MKQTQFAFNDDETLRSELRKINRWQKSGLYSSVLVQHLKELLLLILLMKISVDSLSTICFH